MDLWNQLKRAFQRDRKNRLYFSLAVGLAAIVITSSKPVILGNHPLCAWWGTMYPQFCFSSVAGEEDSKEQQEPKEPKKVKLSFWLAKALDWC